MLISFCNLNSFTSSFHHSLPHFYPQATSSFHHQVTSFSHHQAFNLDKKITPTHSYEYPHLYDFYCNIFINFHLHPRNYYYSLNADTYVHFRF